MFTSESKKCRDMISLVKLTGEVVDLVPGIQHLIDYKPYELTWGYHDYLVDCKVS